MAMLLRSLVYSLIGGVGGAVVAFLVTLVLSPFWGSAAGLIGEVLLFGGLFGAASFPIIGLIWDDGDWFWKDPSRR